MLVVDHHHHLVDMVQAQATAALPRVKGVMVVPLLVREVMVVLLLAREAMVAPLLARVGMAVHPKEVMVVRLEEGMAVPREGMVDHRQARVVMAAHPLKEGMDLTKGGRARLINLVAVERQDFWEDFSEGSTISSSHHISKARHNNRKLSSCSSRPRNLAMAWVLC